MSTEKSTKAIDLSHHLSQVSKLRKVSPLSDLHKYHGRPGMISLSGGIPDPAYFPFASISADALVTDSFPRAKPSESSLFSWFWSIFGAGSSPTEKTERFTVPKYATHKGDVELATSLQYGASTGVQPLQDFIREFTSKIFKPAYSDWTTLVHIGNTNGIHRALSTFCNPGEHLLVEEWTYPTALAMAIPVGLVPVSIKVDGHGMSATDLEHVLSTWDETVRGAKRPHVMYTIPIGQNPTGTSMDKERKKAIYTLCVKYDIVIIEDDPYYFLQEGTYTPKALRTQPQPPSKSKTRLWKGKDDNEETRFINSLEPSFVRFDFQGRVVRLDTFSKGRPIPSFTIIAPGSRMGWFTCNPVFAERLEREGESSVLSPCGFSQSLVIQLVTTHWGFPKLIRWLQGLQTQYTIRRDFFVDCIYEEFDVRTAGGSDTKSGAFGAGIEAMTAYVKTREEDGTEQMSEMKTKKVPLFSFVPPSAGMFLWLKFHVKAPASMQAATDPAQSIDKRVWTDLANNGLLITPGSNFAADQGNSPQTVPQEIPFRMSYSYGSQETLKAAVKILAKVLKKYTVS